jgi:hypothetical protein
MTGRRKKREKKGKNEGINMNERKRKDIQAMTSV